MGRTTVTEWGYLLDGAHQEKRKLLDYIIKEVESRDPPRTSWEFIEVKTKGWAFLPVGENLREFLRFHNEDIRDYTVDVSVEPYGNTLTVHAGVVVAGAIESWNQEDWDREMSWEEKTVLSDWVSVIFRSCREAAQQLSDEVGGDADPFKRKAEGPLSVW